MFVTDCKKRVIYFQSILLLLSSFSLLVQNAMATSCHIKNDGIMMPMQISVQINQQQMNDVSEKCCGNCNCIEQQCMSSCSMLNSIVIAISTNAVDSLFLDNASAVATMPIPFGISHLPERHPPRLTVL